MENCKKLLAWKDRTFQVIPGTVLKGAQSGRKNLRGFSFTESRNEWSIKHNFPKECVHVNFYVSFQLGEYCNVQITIK